LYKGVFVIRGKDVAKDHHRIYRIFYINILYTNIPKRNDYYKIFFTKYETFFIPTHKENV